MHELKIVRERARCAGPARVIRTARDVYDVFHERFAALDREQFAVVLLDGRNAALGFNIVSIGTLTAALVHPREVFKPALLCDAAALIRVHNHPSGDPDRRPKTERSRSAWSRQGSSSASGSSIS